jgi:hypothetical protein
MFHVPSDPSTIITSEFLGLVFGPVFDWGHFALGSSSTRYPININDFVHLYSLSMMHFSDVLGILSCAGCLPSAARSWRLSLPVVARSCAGCLPFTVSVWLIHFLPFLFHEQFIGRSSSLGANHIHSISAHRKNAVVDSDFVELLVLLLFCCLA